MKLSGAILRGGLVFVAVCVIQGVAGTLTMAAVKVLQAPNAVYWTLLSNALVVASLVLVAVRSDWRGWRLAAALAGVPLAIGCLNGIEGVVFLTNVGMDWRRFFLYMIVSAILIMPVWMVLFGKRSDVAQPHFHPAASKSLEEMVWKFLVSDAAYVFFYLGAGTIVFPYVKDYYATQHLPAMGSLIALQLLVRGPIFIVICLALIRMLSLRGLRGALVVGLVFTLLSAVTPLLIPNPYLPDAVRWAHMCEVTSSNFLFGAMMAWLWGEPNPARGLALRQAA
jgi:hypothetical protein